MKAVTALSVGAVLAGLSLAAGLAFAAPRPATAQEPGLQAAIQATMQGAVNAWNQRDVGAFLSFWTDNGLQDEFELTHADAAVLGEFIGDPQIRLLMVSNVRQVSATSATAVVDLAIGFTVERTQRTFVLEGGRWKLDVSTLLAAPIPAGVTTVDVQLVEYAFVYDKTAAASGNIAFRTRNTGAEQHELALVRIDPAAPALFELIQSLGPDEEPEGIEFVSGGGPWDPGEQSTIVFTQALVAGRYGMVCFIEAPDGVPHALKGMVSEFTVGTGAGAPAIRPPSTGSGGLLPADSFLSAGYAFAAALVLAGGAGLLVTRPRRTA